MSGSRQLIDRIQYLNHQRLENVKGAHEDMLMAMLELKYEVQLPWETLWETRLQMLHSICKRMAIEMGLVQAIADRDGAPVSAKELSSGTGFDQRVIERLLRLLARIRLISNAGENEFKATEVTKLLNSQGITAWDKVLYFCGSLPDEMLYRRDWSASIPREWEEGTIQFRIRCSIYEYIAQRPRLKHDFDLAMSARRDGLLPQWFHIYPVMEKLTTDVAAQSKVVIVDVAGNKAYDFISFAAEYPEFEGTMILEDLPSTFAQLNTVERSKIKAAGINLQEYNFFTPQPIKGANIYFIRDVLHDWPDKEAVQLLSQTAEVMEPGQTRILIEDHVIDTEDVHHTPAAADILLMLILNGIERTLEGWKMLLKESGLSVVKVWPNGAGHQSIIEAVKI